MHLNVVSIGKHLVGHIVLVIYLFSIIPSDNQRAYHHGYGNCHEKAEHWECYSLYATGACQYTQSVAWGDSKIAKALHW